LSSYFSIDNNPLILGMGLFVLVTGIIMSIFSDHISNLIPISIGAIMIWISSTDPRWTNGVSNEM